MLLLLLGEVLYSYTLFCSSKPFDMHVQAQHTQYTYAEQWGGQQSSCGRLRALFKSPEWCQWKRSCGLRKGMVMAALHSRVFPAPARGFELVITSTGLSKSLKSCTPVLIVKLPRPPKWCTNHRGC